MNDDSIGTDYRTLADPNWAENFCSSTDVYIVFDSRHTIGCSITANRHSLIYVNIVANHYITVNNDT